MTSIEQKNKNILSRFENDKTGSKIAVFDIKTKCGKEAVMVSMHGASHYEAIERCMNVFGGNVEKVEARQ